MWRLAREKRKQGEIGREANHKRLLISQNKLRVPGRWGYGEGGWVMDIGEGICYGECCEVCKPDDTQTCTPGANNILYVNKKCSYGILSESAFQSILL